MNENTYFENSLTDTVCRRAFAARLDMTLKRAKMTSKRVAQSLGVPEHDVTLWRVSVAVPRGEPNAGAFPNCFASTSRGSA